ncbi:ribosomal protein L37AE/L43A [Phyllobacterium sp. P30BS-XVII]|nr:ribosomal protein L37AE/L43A [Phyllobacterium sp. P30BS-XVII]
MNADDTITCPRCRQGLVIPVKVKRTGEVIYLCEECEAVWFSPDTIDYATFNYFNLYMERLGLPDSWAELERIQR